MGQQITPLAPQGSRFEPMNPGLPDRPDWLAGQAVIYRGESGSQDPAGSDQRVQPRLHHWRRRHRRTHGTARTRTSTCSSTTFRRPRRSRSKSCRSPTPTTGLSSIHPARLFTWPAAPVTMSTFLLGAPPPEPGRRPRVRRLPWATTLGIGLNIQPNGAVAINSQVGVHPCAAGVAISNDGQTLVVANYYNDSITVFTGGLGNWSKRRRTRPAPRQERPLARRACRAANIRSGWW